MGEQRKFILVQTSTWPF